MGGRPARDVPRGRPLKKLLAVLVGAVLLVGCTPRSRPGNEVPPLDRLNSAVSAVSTARGALLGAVEAVKGGARALDATDALCAKGHGVAARTSERGGATAVSRSTAAVRNLPTLVDNYRASLRALDRSRTAVSGAARAALTDVVRDGELEATAIATFEHTVSSAWQQYVSLDGQQRVWITRAVSGWYRSDKEAADAYAVLVGSGRRLLTVARTQVAQASAAVQGPTAAQAATLAAADRALASVRNKR